MKFRNVLRTVVPVVTAVAALAAPAGVAHADHWPLCVGSTGWFCVFKNEGGHDGGVRVFSGSDSNYSGDTFERCFVNCDLNDATSSLWNRESYTVRSFVAASHCGVYFNTSSGVKRTTMPAGYNDALSSHGTTSATC